MDNRNKKTSKETDKRISKDEIIKKLKEVLDPELGINIVDMGLIYKVEERTGKQKSGQQDKQQFYIEMMFTTPACPLMSFMLEDVRSKLSEFASADFELVVITEPAWTPERLSKDAKKKLGF